MKPRSNAQWRNFAVIALIALISIVPMALAWYYARHPELVSRTSNYGTLIVPPRPLDGTELLARPVGPASRLAEIKGRWVLVQVASGGCGESCRETLHKTHQIRLMLNKEIPRVRRLLLVPAGSAVAGADALLEEDEALAMAEVPETLIRTLAEALGKPPAEDMVLLMDPLANVILWYGPGFDPYGMVKDLKHLLRASQIG